MTLIPSFFGVESGHGQEADDGRRDGQYGGPSADRQVQPRATRRVLQERRPTSEVGWQGAAQIGAITRGRQESGRGWRVTRYLRRERSTLAFGRLCGKPWGGQGSNSISSGFASLAYFRRTSGVHLCPAS